MPDCYQSSALSFHGIEYRLYPSNPNPPLQLMAHPVAEATMLQAPIQRYLTGSGGEHASDERHPEFKVPEEMHRCYQGANILRYGHFQCIPFLANESETEASAFVLQSIQITVKPRVVRVCLNVQILTARPRALLHVLKAYQCHLGCTGQQHIFASIQLHLIARLLKN